MFKFLIFYLIINCESKRLIEIQCPTYCKCDLFANLRRANCVNKNLVVLQSYLPKQTELLDLSYNQISDLSDHIFFVSINKRHCRFVDYTTDQTVILGRKFIIVKITKHIQQ